MYYGVLVATFVSLFVANLDIQWTFDGSNTDGAVAMAVSNLCLCSLEKYSRRFGKIWGDIAVDFGKFRIILIFVLKMVCWMLSLEPPRGGYFNEAINHPFMLEKEIKDIPVVPPDLAL